MKNFLLFTVFLFSNQAFSYLLINCPNLRSPHHEIFSNNKILLVQNGDNDKAEEYQRGYFSKSSLRGNHYNLIERESDSIFVFYILERENHNCSAPERPCYKKTSNFIKFDKLVFRELKKKIKLLIRLV